VDHLHLPTARWVSAVANHGSRFTEHSPHIQARVWMDAKTDNARSISIYRCIPASHSHLQTNRPKLIPDQRTNLPQPMDRVDYFFLGAPLTAISSTLSPGVSAGFTAWMIGVGEVGAEQSTRGRERGRHFCEWEWGRDCSTCHYGEDICASMRCKHMDSAHRPMIGEKGTYGLGPCAAPKL
jgi:hypothetical protein